MTKRALGVVILSFLTACHSSPSSTSPTSPTSAAKLAVDQTSYSFPATLVGTVANSPMFSLSATGGGSLTVASVTSSNPSEFPLTDSSCVGKTLVAGASAPCQMSVRFQPAAAGVRSAQVVVTSSDGGTIALDVFGSAITPGGSSPGGGGGGGSGGGGGGGGGSFPQAPCVPNTTGGIVFNIINTSSFLIQVTLAGPTNVTTSVPSGAIQVFALAPGNYTLSGVLPGTTNSTFTPSMWSVVNGCDYLLQLKTS
jgi:hypothetical protein